MRTRDGSSVKKRIKNTSLNKNSENEERKTKVDGELIPQTVGNTESTRKSTPFCLVKINFNNYKTA